MIMAVLQFHAAWTFFLRYSNLTLLKTYVIQNILTYATMKAFLMQQLFNTALV